MIATQNPFRRMDDGFDTGNRPGPMENTGPRLPGGVNVLLVDDHPEELRLIGEVLRRAGARVILATDSTEGLRLARNLRPGVILLDVSLPPHNGFALCEQIRNDAVTAKIPVLFLSGHTDAETKLQGFRVGGQDYITKPFVEAEVLIRVALHFDIACRLSGNGGNVQRLGEAPAWLARAVSLMQADLATTPKLTALAHTVGTNPRSLNEAFRKHLGNTVFGFLRETRLKEAHRLLSETALPIQHISARVGYPQAANFATAFRERFGVSPREMRREVDQVESTLELPC